MTLLQLIGIIFGTLVSAGMIFMAGWKIKKLRKSNNKYVKSEDCHTLRHSLQGKITFVQYLLMEITTPEQQGAAKQKMSAFQ